MTHLFVHYHLRPGGVTRVLQQQATAFAARGIAFATLSAGPECGAGEHRTIPLLDYANASEDCEQTLWDALQAAAKEFPQPWIWHIHNPSLGCHPAMAAIIQRLAQEKERLILQIHDFAEDKRPENLQRLQAGTPWFPQSARIHYVVLTPRDRDVLCRAGLYSSQVTVLSNPIEAQPAPLANRSDACVLYPTRAINRKNIGEMLLLAALAPAGTTFSTTLSPGASQHQKEYAHWRRLAAELALPIYWAIAETGNFPPTLEQCIARSTHLLSTSTQEGFGMAFLESIAWQRPLIGRAIPHIQENLAQHGIVHPFLYEGMMVDTDEFSEQPMNTQIALLRSAIEHPASVRVIHNQTEIDASSWLATALAPDRRALPLPLLEAFHPQHHTETIHQIATQLRDAPASTISQLDADSIRRSFSA